LDWTLDEIRSLSALHLESLYARDTRAMGQPRGRYRGHALWQMQNDVAQSRLYRVLDAALFRVPPWGIDFEQRRWFFLGSPKLAAGHFEISPRASRWRNAETFGLEYTPSRLPLRGILYDEVKMLSPRWMIGIGGINRDEGGDHFWFALEKQGS
jgi:hypothetical protein